MASGGLGRKPARCRHRDFTRRGDRGSGRDVGQRRDRCSFSRDGNGCRDRRRRRDVRQGRDRGFRRDWRGRRDRHRHHGLRLSRDRVGRSTRQRRRRGVPRPCLDGGGCSSGLARRRLCRERVGGGCGRCRQRRPGGSHLARYRTGGGCTTSGLFGLSAIRLARARGDSRGVSRRRACRSTPRPSRIAGVLDRRADHSRVAKPSVDGVVKGGHRPDCDRRRSGLIRRRKSRARLGTSGRPQAQKGYHEHSSHDWLGLHPWRWPAAAGAPRCANLTRGRRPSRPSLPCERNRSSPARLAEDMQNRGLSMAKNAPKVRPNAKAELAARYLTRKPRKARRNGKRQAQPDARPECRSNDENRYMQLQPRSSVMPDEAPAGAARRRRHPGGRSLPDSRTKTPPSNPEPVPGCDRGFGQDRLLVNVHIDQETAEL